MSRRELRKLARQQRPRRRWGWIWIIIGLFFAVPAMFREFGKIIQRQVGPIVAQERALTEARFTTNGGDERDATFSPDGDQAAYSWNGPEKNNFDIYVKPVDPGEPRRLTKDPREDFAPAWSPDGQTIAFLRRAGASDELIFLGVGSGTERKAGELQHGDRHRLAWTQDGRGLIFSDRPAPGGAWMLYRLNIATGEKKALSKPGDGVAGDFDPAVSPSGSKLAFVRQAQAGAELYTMSIEDSEVTEEDLEQVTELNGNVAEPEWIDRSELVFTSGTGDSRGLWRVRASEKSVAKPLNGVGAGGASPAVAPKGRRMLYTRRSAGAGQLFLVDRFR
jgi:Tol biopolymer transport system component